MEKESRAHAEHLRELRIMQQQKLADIIRHMNEYHRGAELARKSLDGTPNTGSARCSCTVPKISWISPHGKKYCNSSSCSALDKCPSKDPLHDLREAVITSVSTA